MNKSNFVKETINSIYGPQLGSIIFNNSYLLQYVEKKTKSVDSSSKSRNSFANLYAIYALVEDYLNKNFHNTKNYNEYDGMMYTDAMASIHRMPFGEKLQNHAINNRCNDEFRKFFIKSTVEVPIIRNLTTKRYWINEKLLLVHTPNGIINIAKDYITLINKYIELKLETFQSFFYELQSLKDTYQKNPQKAVNYIISTLKPTTDARLFEIVSFVILKYYYIQQQMTYSINNMPYQTVPLMLYKTGRTNANDGGIDYIMLPLGRIFQVTEVLDFKKYFLDIDKLLHYPITFVVKQNITPNQALDTITKAAQIEYHDNPELLKQYLSCFQEIITIPVLNSYLHLIIKNGLLENLIDELILQCKVEYNFDIDIDE